jgi:hypothetical protein
MDLFLSSVIIKRCLTADAHSTFDLNSRCSPQGSDCVKLRHYLPSSRDNRIPLLSFLQTLVSIIEAHSTASPLRPVGKRPQELRRYLPF